MADSFKLPFGIYEQVFNQFIVRFNIPSMCLTGLSDEKDIESVKWKLIDGEIRFIFVVDLYNESVYIARGKYHIVYQTK